MTNFIMQVVYLLIFTVFFCFLIYGFLFYTRKGKQVVNKYFSQDEEETCKETVQEKKETFIEEATGVALSAETGEAFGRDIGKFISTLSQLQDVSSETNKSISNELTSHIKKHSSVENGVTKIPFESILVLTKEHMPIVNDRGEVFLRFFKDKKDKDLVVSDSSILEDAKNVYFENSKIASNNKLELEATINKEEEYESGNDINEEFFTTEEDMAFIYGEEETNKETPIEKEAQPNAGFAKSFMEDVLDNENEIFQPVENILTSATEGPVTGKSIRAFSLDIPEYLMGIDLLQEIEKYMQMDFTFKAAITSAIANNNKIIFFKKTHVLIEQKIFLKALLDITRESLSKNQFLFLKNNLKNDFRAINQMIRFFINDDKYIVPEFEKVRIYCFSVNGRNYKGFVMKTTRKFIEDFLKIGIDDDFYNSQILATESTASPVDSEFIYNGEG